MKRITTILLSLSLFGLVGCDDLVKNFDFDEEGYGHLNWDILDYCESPAANAYDNYSDAMRMSGLDEVLAEGGYTCIIPNNEAFISFISAAGYSRLEEVPGPVLRDLLSYLIFPGDYRVSTMEVGEECTVNSLRGEPITIKRSTNAKSYTLTINGVDGLAAITVESQDYLFKNNIVGQMVEVMPYYRPSVPATSPKPEGYVAEGVTEQIAVTHDTFINAAGKTTNYNNNKNDYGMRLQDYSGNYCWALLRFPLPESDLVKNLAVAKLVVHSHYIGTAYKAGDQLNLSINEMNEDLVGEWDETTVTYNSVVKIVGHYKYLRAALAGATTFVYPSVISKTEPCKIEIDITSSILGHYNAGDTFVDYVAYNTSDYVGVKGAEIRIMDKDYQKKYDKAAYILLQGPSVSLLSVSAVNPLVTTGISTPFTHEILVIDTPDATANPEGYDYSSQNIVLTVAEQPTNGVLTLYGIPIQKGHKFTYEEMKGGFVKYVRIAEGEDSFQLKVMDYLDGMVPEPVTITVQ